MHRILVVSPNRTTRAQLRDRLGIADFEIETASVLPLAPQGWDAILTDLDPGADEAFELSRGAVLFLIDPGATTRRLGACMPEVECLTVADAAGWEALPSIVIDRLRTERRQDVRRTLTRPTFGELDHTTGLWDREHGAAAVLSARFRNDRRRTVSCVAVTTDVSVPPHGLMEALGDTVRRMALPADIAIRWSQSEVMIVRRVGAVETWMFAEHLRRRMRRLGSSCTVSVGVASGDLDDLGSLLLDAEHASCLAASRGGSRTCTDRMVMAERLADEIEFLIGGDPEHRRSVFLSHAWSELGSGQRHYVDGHCRQVSGASYDLARSIGLDADDVEIARLAGLFHDLGKCVVPETLLSCEGRLTSGEREIVRRMNEESVRLAALLGLCPASCAVIDELGQESPRTTIARVVRIADAICAMTSPRSPARMKAMHDAIATLEGDARFDSGIVEHVRQRRAA